MRRPDLDEPNPFNGLVPPSGARTPNEFLSCSAWWLFEAERGTAAAHSRWYAANMRGAAERRLRDNVTIRLWTPGYDVPAPRESADE